MRSLVDRVPATVGLRLRGEKNRRSLFGVNAPATLLSSMVREGSVVLDLGANRGLYTYWLARRARTLHAFEPNPRLASYLSSARIRNVVVHSVAASARSGMAQLEIPDGDGEARVVEPDEAAEGLRIWIRTLAIDDLELTDVSFVKVDVEGHEQAAIAGAAATLEGNRPIVFIELEERHRKGTVAEVARYFARDLGYASAWFMRGGRFYALDRFDAATMQPPNHPDRPGPDYVSNFLFVP